MKDFEKKYKEYLDNINLSNQEFELIKNNIINENKTKKFKLKYALIIIMVVFISCLTIANANKVINKLIISSNDKSTNTIVTFDSNLDKDIDSNLFKENYFYTYDEIEKKLGFKLLKSNNFDSSLFKLGTLKSKNNKVAILNFVMYNPDETLIVSKPYMSITIQTKYSSEKLNLQVLGHVSKDKYYIKSLNREANLLIYDANTFSPVDIQFVYDNIAYNINIPEVMFNSDEGKNYVFSILESLKL